MRTFVSGKIHGIRVTSKSVAYHGSVGLSRELLAAVEIQPFEQVHIVNLTTGSRWITYALPLDEPGAFSLNGGGARLGEVGDECVVMSFETRDTYRPAKVVHLNEHNAIKTRLEYAS